MELGLEAGPGCWSGAELGMLGLESIQEILPMDLDVDREERDDPRMMTGCSA